MEALLEAAGIGKIAGAAAAVAAQANGASGAGAGNDTKQLTDPEVNILINSFPSKVYLVTERNDSRLQKYFFLKRTFSEKMELIFFINF